MLHGGSAVSDEAQHVLLDSLEPSEIEPQLLEALPRRWLVVECGDHGLGEPLGGEVIRHDSPDEAEPFKQRGADELFPVRIHVRNHDGALLEPEDLEYGVVASHRDDQVRGAHVVDKARREVEEPDPSAPGRGGAGFALSADSLALLEGKLRSSDDEAKNVEVLRQSRERAQIGIQHREPDSAISDRDQYEGSGRDLESAASLLG